MPDQPTKAGAPSFRLLSGERVGERDSAPVLNPDIAGFVLAGGQSTRMGRDKALLPFAGQPLAIRALDLLRESGLQASLAGANSSLASFAPVVDDRESGLGPLSGICAALAATSAQMAVFLPVDLPLLPPSLITLLVHHAQVTCSAVTVPSVSGFTQTFPAVLDRAMLPMLSAELAAGRRGCFAAFQAAAASLGQTVTVVAAELFVQAGQCAHPRGTPPVHWFLNVNTPADLKRAEGIA